MFSYQKIDQNDTKLKHYLLLILLWEIITLFSTPNYYAQNNEIRFSHLTSEDGLSMSAVTAIYQDSKGFLWLGTYGGLNRFNGYNFKIFRPIPSNPNSISNHVITSIFEDLQGYLWIGTYNGLNKFDPRTQLFHSYKKNPANPKSLSNNRVSVIYEDREGILWIGTDDGLNKFNKETNEFMVIRQSSDMLDAINEVNCIKEDKNGNIWYGTWEGVFCINKNGKLLKRLSPNKNKPYKISSKNISTLYFDDNENLWIGTNGDGLDLYNINTGTYQHYSKNNNENSLSNDFINVIFKDKLNNVWIGTKHGLNKFNRRQNNFTRIYHNPLNGWTINDNEVLSILEDRTGVVWIGTEGGLNSFNQLAHKFWYYDENRLNPDFSLSNNRVNAVIVDSKNNLWIGTRDGLDEIKANEKNVTKYAEYFKEKSADNHISCLLEDKTGKLWIGSPEGGLHLFDPVTKKIKIFKHDKNDPTSISNNGVLSICEDCNGNLWFSTWWGFNRFDKKTEKFQQFIADPNNPNSFKDNAIWKVFEDSEGMIWLGTESSGLSKFDPVSGKFTNFLYDSLKTKKSNGFVGERVFSIFETSDKILWIGTSNGLNSYNRKTGKFTLYNKTNGLPSDVINSVEEDNKGSLWISTDKGLSKFDRKTGEFTNYNKRNGLTTLEFSRSASFKAKDGILYFGTRTGLIFFHPDSIKENNLDVSVVFTDFKIYNQSVPISEDGLLKESISSIKSISIPYSVDVITFEFALLDFYNARSNKFLYKLQGFDKDWNNVGTRNNASYTNLPPGEYLFMVKGYNEEGVKTAKEATLRLTVVPPFYMTWWFRILLVLGLVLLVGLIIQSRTYKIKKQNSILEKKVTERTRDLDKTIKELNQEIASKDKFFSIIAHDLRGPFTGVIGLVKYLNEELESLTNDDLHTISEGILKSTQLTYDLLENLLNWARIKTGRISFEKEEICLGKILTETINLFKENLLSKNLKLNVDIDENLNVYADPNMVKAVVRNILSNSIKFTEDKGSIYISAKSEGNFVETTIRDTGVGMSQEKINKLFQIGENVSSLGTHKEKGTGLGLILCKEFIDLNRGKISVRSKLGEGSEFSFTLPTLVHHK